MSNNYNLPESVKDSLAELRKTLEKAANIQNKNYQKIMASLTTNNEAYIRITANMQSTYAKVFESINVPNLETIVVKSSENLFKFVNSPQYQAMINLSNVYPDLIDNLDISDITGVLSQLSDEEIETIINASSADDLNDSIKESFSNQLPYDYQDQKTDNQSIDSQIIDNTANDIAQKLAFEITKNLETIHPELLKNKGSNHESTFFKTYIFPILLVIITAIVTPICSDVYNAFKNNLNNSEQLQIDNDSLNQGTDPDRDYSDDDNQKLNRIEDGNSPNSNRDFFA